MLAGVIDCDLLLLAGVLHEIVIVRHDCGVGVEVGSSAAGVIFDPDRDVGTRLLVWVVECA
jgi:hypothetical protein